jgi:hypothetical protein
MASIHLIDGEKGGVGKSLFCRVLIEYFWHNGQKNEVGIIDADRNLPLIGRTYAPALYPCEAVVSTNQALNTPVWSQALNPNKFRWLYFSDTDEILYQWDDLFNLAINYPIILNLPSNVYQQVTKWFNNNDLLNVGQEVGVTFWKWFVTTGEDESRAFLKTSLTDFGERLHHVVVKNYGLTEWELSWLGFEGERQLQEALTRFKAQVITLPKLQLSQGRYDAIKEAYHPLSYVISPQSPYPVLERARVKRFLEQAWQQLDLIAIPDFQATQSVEVAEGTTQIPRQSPESKGVATGSSLKGSKKGSASQSENNSPQVPEAIINQF